MYLYVLILSLCLYFQCTNGYGEQAANGRPVYEDRASQHLTNVVRIAPVPYKGIYLAGYSPSVANILTPGVYPAVKPVYFEPTLNDAAYAHSLDMSTHTGCFKHDSCDNTNIWTRIKSYYTCSGTLSENIAAGNLDPLSTMGQWLCDKDGTVCAPDSGGQPAGYKDGHRLNIMSGSYKALGTGYAYNANMLYNHFWTQDFGGATCSVISNPIYSGTHLVMKDNTFKYGAVFYLASTSPTGSVFINGVQQTLTLEMGSAGQANYVYNVASEPTGACVEYYFQFTNGATTYRYPDTGCLLTYASGSCMQSFVSSCTSGGASSSSGAVGPSTSTSGTPTTPKPSTTSPATPKPTTTDSPASTSGSASGATTSVTPSPTTTGITDQQSSGVSVMVETMLFVLVIALCL